VRDPLLGVLAPVVLLGAWQLLAGSGLLDPRVFTPPTQIGSAAAQLAAAGTLQTDITATSPLACSTR
jgi:sulfonate transport system permease protein